MADVLKELEKRDWTSYLLWVVLTLAALAFCLWPEPDTIKAGSTYRDRDGTEHVAEQTMKRDGNGYWYDQQGNVVNGE